MIRGYAAGLYHLQETMPFVFPLYTSYRQTDRQTIGLSFLQDIKTCCLSVFLHLYPYSPTIYIYLHKMLQDRQMDIDDKEHIVGYFRWF